MQNLENMDVFEILIAQKVLKCPKDPFVKSALNYIFWYHSEMTTMHDDITHISHDLDVFMPKT